MAGAAGSARRCALRSRCRSAAHGRLRVKRGSRRRRAATSGAWGVPKPTRGYVESYSASSYDPSRTVRLDAAAGGASLVQTARWLPPPSTASHTALRRTRPHNTVRVNVAAVARLPHARLVDSLWIASALRSGSSSGSAACTAVWALCAVGSNEVIRTAQKPLQTAEREPPKLRPFDCMRWLHSSTSSHYPARC